MMAYERNNMNPNAFLDHLGAFEPSHLQGKLDDTVNLTMGGLVGQLQPGLRQQFNSINVNNNANNNGAQPQISFANLQLQMNAAQATFANNHCSNDSNMNLQPTPMRMNPSSYPEATTLMNTMAMQQPMFQATFQQRQQQTSGVPSFISFNNDVSTNDMKCNAPKPLLATYEPSNMGIHKPLFGGLEPLPVAEKADLPKSDVIKSAPSSAPCLPPRCVSKSKRLLPADFQPTGNYVICGNKRKYFESKGNIRFREVCKLFLQEYIQAPTKIEKSAVVTKVMNILREDCPEGAFVSPQGGRWYAVSERTAREKIGTYFRDCLSDSYKSSAKNKIARRKIIKKASANNSANNSCSKEETKDADDGSLGSISFYDVDDLTPVPL